MFRLDVTKDSCCFLGSWVFSMSGKINITLKVLVTTIDVLGHY